MLKGFPKSRFIPLSSPSARSASLMSLVSLPDGSGRQPGSRRRPMKLLRRFYSKREFGEPAIAMLADTVLLATVIAGGLIFSIYITS